MQNAELRTQVEFRSSAFPAYENEEDEINPGCWGKRLAEYLKGKFEEVGILTEEIYFEDWGVVLPLKNETFPLWIGCGHYREYPDGFLCFIEPRKPYVRRWFRKIDTTATVSHIADTLDKILRANPSISDIRWWEASEK